MSASQINYSDAVETARQYYNSDDADQFYRLIWGGEDIHVGWYETAAESIFTASRRTIERMATRLEDAVPTGCKVLDLGSGYGGAARYLAGKYDWHVTALNLSEAENQRCRQLNAEQGLDRKVTVIDGSFENIPAGDGVFDVVWSQDSILHSGNRDQVIAEVSRVLREGGRFVFTDPMQADDCPQGVLQPILDRIHLASLGSPGFYREQCRRFGLEEIEFIEVTEHLIQHYRRVLEETEKRQSQLAHHISLSYIDRMKAGLRHWIDGGEKGFLAWGIFQFCRTT